MRPSISKLALAVLLFGITLLPTGATSNAAPTPPDSAPAESIQVAAPFQVRLRKLHLVRPDLIPYPIFFESYC